jgi:hypothetical protein
MYNKIISIDAETDGLWGRPFAVAMTVYDEKDKEIDKFISMQKYAPITDNWVLENVIPALSDITPDAESYLDLLEKSAEFYMKHKENATVICHVGHIVEANLIREWHDNGFIGDWDAPYPLIDVSAMLQLLGEDPVSVDAFAKKYCIYTTDYGTTHNPLYDCEVAARVYQCIMKGEFHIIR